MPKQRRMVLRGMGQGGARGGGDWKTMLSRTLLGAAATFIAGWLDKKIDQRRLPKHIHDLDTQDRTELKTSPGADELRASSATSKT